MAQRLMSLMKSFFRLERRSCFRLMPIKLEWLPEEMLLRIMSYLKIQELLRFSHVSKRIRRICNDKTLWKIVDLSNKKMKPEFIKAVLKNDCENLNLQHTKIDGSIKLSKTSKLKYLNLEMCLEVSKTFFNEILLSCCSLQKLVLGEPGQYLDTSLLQRIFSKNGQTLEALNFGFSYCDPIFWFSCPSYLDNRMQSMMLVKLILTHCTKLQEINLECCDLTHDALSQLVYGLSPEMKKVSLPGNAEVTDEHIETLVRRCNKIIALDIGGYGPRFKYCDISHLTNNAITSILNHLFCLTELDVTGCPNITLEKVLELESLPKLQVLNYGVTSNDDNAHNNDWGSKYLDEMPGLMKKLPHLIINKKVDDDVISVGDRIAKI